MNLDVLHIYSSARDQRNFALRTRTKSYKWTSTGVHELRSGLVSTHGPITTGTLNTLKNRWSYKKTHTWPCFSEQNKMILSLPSRSLASSQAALLSSVHAESKSSFAPCVCRSESLHPSGWKQNATSLIIESETRHCVYMVGFFWMTLTILEHQTLHPIGKRPPCEQNCC